MAGDVDDYSEVRVLDAKHEQALPAFSAPSIRVQEMSTMSRINTKLTRLLGIRTPVVAAPMAGASSAALAIQVTHGGGFAFLAPGYDTPQKFASELSLARSALEIDSAAQLAIGVGFLGWQLQQLDSPALELLRLSLDSRVKAVWLAFGSDLGRWVEYVRSHDQEARSEHKTLVFVQVSSLEEALVAVNDWKVDVVVAQGIESGGHGNSASPPLLTLLPSILTAVPKDGPPILAAGGLSSGAHVAALLTLGASGAVLGTRFLLSPESLYTNAQKDALLQAGSNSAVRTTAFDHARGTLSWPSGVDGRALRNATVEEFEKGVGMEDVRSRFAEAVRKGDPDRMLVWAGTGVGLMHAIKPAKEIVQELHEECIGCLMLSRSLIL